MRSIIAILLFLSMMTVFSACGSSGSTADESSVETVQSNVTSISTPTTKEQVEPEEPTDTEESTTSAQENGPEPIILSWDEEGEYGKTITWNANTELPYTCIQFFIPTGTYQVTNNSSKVGSQVTVYDEGINVTEKGWEEPVGEAGNNVVLMPGESGELTIKEGQYVKLADSSENIYFVRTGD